MKGKSLRRARSLPRFHCGAVLINVAKLNYEFNGPKPGNVYKGSRSLNLRDTQLTNTDGLTPTLLRWCGLLRYVKLCGSSMLKQLNLTAWYADSKSASQASIYGHVLGTGIQLGLKIRGPKGIGRSTRPVPTNRKTVDIARPV